MSMPSADSGSVNNCNSVFGLTLPSFERHKPWRKKYKIQFLFFFFNFFADRINIFNQGDFGFDKDKVALRIQGLKFIEKGKRSGFRAPDDVHFRGVRLFRELIESALANPTCAADGEC